MPGWAVRCDLDTISPAVLGVAADRVRVVMHDFGGNFGTRGNRNRTPPRDPLLLHPRRADREYPDV
jgi:hypothetical protein